MCVSLTTAAASDQQLDKVLTGRFHEKLVRLRLPLEQNSQEFNAEGQPLTAANMGPWTVYGGMIVNKIVIDSDKLRLEGKRVLYVFKDDRLAPFREDDKVRITIRLNAPLSSEEDANAVLNRVFLSKNEDVLDSVPPYWRQYLAHPVVPANKPKTGEDQKSSEPQNHQGISSSPALTDQHPIPWDQEVAHVGEANVTAPKILFQPEPEFSDPARKLHLKGVVGLNIVVDQAGRVSDVRIVKPMGAGLDENAVNTVRTWRFAPATKDGRPVAVAVYIEVDFHWSY
jgi:TonB family protein